MAWDDEDDEADYAGFDTSEPDDEATIPCPFCGEEIYDDAECCPECGRYLTKEDAPSQPKSWWVVAGVVICIAIVVAWAMGMM